MENLFVIHTQYSLVLAVGILKNRFSEDSNDLILFEDFLPNQNIKTTLQRSFNTVLFRPGTHSLKGKNKVSTFFTYLQSIKALQNNITKKYNRVFIVLDMNLVEMRIMKHTFKQYPKAEFIALEDGAYPYFLNHDNPGGFDTNKVTRNIRSFIFKYLLSCGKFYSFEGRFMGANTWLNSIYLTYSNYARPIYDAKVKVEITQKEFSDGVDALFKSTKIKLEKNSVLLILDKLDVYKNFDSIEKKLQEALKNLAKLKVKTYYKYHPRETDHIAIDHMATELDRNIAIESYYKDTVKASPIIIGIKSTGLQTAKKMGFKVVSLSKLLKEDDKQVLQFYKKIGVFVPKTMDEFFKLLPNGK